MDLSRLPAHATCEVVALGNLRLDRLVRRLRSDARLSKGGGDVARGGARRLVSLPGGPHRKPLSRYRRALFDCRGGARVAWAEVLEAGGRGLHYPIFRPVGGSVG